MKYVIEYYTLLCTNAIVRGHWGTVNTVNTTEKKKKNKPQHREGSATYFVSLGIIGLKSETPHMVQFESPQDHKMGILFTAIPHKKN